MPFVKTENKEHTTKNLREDYENVSQAESDDYEKVSEVREDNEKLSLAEGYLYEGPQGSGIVPDNNQLNSLMLKEKDNEPIEATYKEPNEGTKEGNTIESQVNSFMSKPAETFEGKGGPCPRLEGRIEGGVDENKFDDHPYSSLTLKGKERTANLQASQKTGNFASSKEVNRGAGKKPVKETGTEGATAQHPKEGSKENASERATDCLFEHCSVRTFGMNLNPEASSSASPLPPSGLSSVTF